MPNQTGVNQSESPTDDLTRTPASGGGKTSSSESLEEVKAQLAEYREAMKKKDVAIEELRGWKDQTESRLEELQRNPHKSVAQENEEAMLRRQMGELDNHEYGRALSAKIKLVSDDVSTEKMTQVERKIDFNNAKDWVEDKCEELLADKDTPKHLRLDPKKFEELLVSRFAGGRWGDKTLKQRVKLAWKEIQAEEAFKKKEADMEKQNISFAETGGRFPRSSSHQSAVELVKEGKVTDALDSIYNAQINEQRRLKGR